MARTIQQIQTQIYGQLSLQPDLADLNSTSVTAVYRLLIYIMSVAIAGVENLFDVFRIDIRNEVAKYEPHTARWYQQKALDYQLGYDLPEGVTEYDNTGIDPDTIGDSKIIEYAAVIPRPPVLEIKVAQSNLLPLSAGELAGFSDYMNEVKDAGVQLAITSQPPDQLQAVINIYYDPEILDSNGRRLDGTNDFPVFIAFDNYTKSLRFDGRFVPALLMDALQSTEGVEIPQIVTMQVRAEGDDNFVNVGVFYEPISGFVRIAQDDLVLNYISYG